MNALVCEKVAQAVEILNELGVDAWLTFVRETTEAADPVLPIILGHHLTWQSALLVTRRGERIAIVGSLDADPVRASGAWPEVIPYVQGIREPLRQTLARLNPRQVAVNFSTDDVKADGLTYGMWRLLNEHLAGTSWSAAAPTGAASVSAAGAGGVISAEQIIAALRGRKSPTEVRRIEAAIAETEAIFAETGRFLRIGQSEREIADFMQEQARRRGLELAWDPGGCPIVNCGPESSLGHSVPSDTIRAAPGHVVHIDFGVKKDGFCSDLQRCWYVPAPGDQGGVPEPVRRAYAASLAAIRAAAAVLRPGVTAWEVDAAARAKLTSAGFPEYPHAVGHQIGRAAHDGGAILAPRWERYGQTPLRTVEAGNVFTLELGVYELPPHGIIGLEEDVLVQTGGVRWLSTPQTEMWVAGV